MTQLSQRIKRFFDVVAVVATSPLIIPIIAIIALLIRITCGRGVIFAQERAGKKMQPFTLYKFRTMRTDVDPFGASPKNGTDRRFTRLGRWLRSWSIDELPQLFNVLKGDMSLVGPRPLYMDQARQWNQRQRRRLEVKPGLTGLAQISGRGGLTIEDKLELDVQYVLSQSLLFDARIILATFTGLFRRQDIYEKRYSRSQETRKPSE